MTDKKDKKDELKPLDMTTDEAMNFLFPKEVVDELKDVANSSKQQMKSDKNGSENSNGDSSYNYNNE